MNATFTGGITLKEAAKNSCYSVNYLRRLANARRILAWKAKGIWRVDLQSVAVFQTAMEELGMGKHNPWRPELAAQGLGRQQTKEVAHEQ